MVAGTSELLRDTRRFASPFDANLLTNAQLDEVVSDLSATKAVIETVIAKASAQLATRGTWKQDGFRSPQDALARRTGTSVGAAQDAISTGRRLEDQPQVEEAALNGEISFAQASLISEAVEADPKCARRLISEAKKSPLRVLKDEVGRTKADACKDPEAKERKIHQERSIREWVDTEGAWNMRAKGTVQDGAQYMAAVKEVADEMFLNAGPKERAERPDARDFDAAIELAKRHTCGRTKSPQKAASAHGPSRSENGSKDSDCRSRSGARVKLIVRIDLDTFIRGYARKGETCELAGYGPVPASVVRDLIENGDPFVAAIMTKGQSLVGVAHLGRKPTSYQRSALEWLYPTCAVEGCRSSAHLEADHTLDWSKTHFTMLDFLDFKCPHHHRLKTTADWDFVKGTREFVPPEDPRHPRHKRKRE